MYAKPAAPLWDARNSLNVSFARRLISLCWTINPKNQIFKSIVSMRSSQIEPVWSQATKITLTSLSCLAGRSRWCTGQEIKAHLCKPIFPTCQLKTEKLVFHQFLEGISMFYMLGLPRKLMPDALRRFWSYQIEVLRKSISWHMSCWQRWDLENLKYFDSDLDLDIFCRSHKVSKKQLTRSLADSYSA